jgi:hypothetical protein
MPSAPVTVAVPPAATASPAQAVTLFYQLVAQHQFGPAAGLWTARMQAAYPPGQNVVGRFSQTQQVIVRRAEVVALDQAGQRATVAVDVLETVGAPPATRRWVGTWQLVRSPGGWLLDQPNLAPA